jgi:hypothetical protein
MLSQVDDLELPMNSRSLLHDNATQAVGSKRTSSFIL